MTENGVMTVRSKQQVSWSPVSQCFNKYTHYWNMGMWHRSTWKWASRSYFFFKTKWIRHTSRHR